MANERIIQRFSLLLPKRFTDMTQHPHENTSDSSGFKDLGWKILLPVAIGLGVVVWLFKREFSIEVWQSIHWDIRVILCIGLALIFTVGRDFGLAWRFRILTDGKLRWWQAVRVTLLCEFTSCVTPTTAGGSALGMIFLNREGISFGRATTLMMTTLLLDELFFVLSIPAVVAVMPYGDLFGFDKTAFSTGLQTAFWIIYGLITAWTLILFLGILVRPRSMHTAINKLFSFRWLRRWREKADTLGADMESTGAELRHRSGGWWCRTFGATVVSWMSRFLVVNALFLGFVPAASQAVVLARQFVVWVILTITPTPGGSGVSEWLFTTYYGDLIDSAGMALILALFWRMISYYIFLITGACIIPSWVRRGFKKSASK